MTQFRFIILIIISVFVFCLYANNAWSMPGKLKVDFLDIGQGDSTLIRTPHGRYVLVDGGPGSTILERLNEETSFWVKRIDLILLTHPDKDHLEGLIEVLKRYEVGRVVMTGVIHHSRLYETFLDLLFEQSIDVSVASPQQDWIIDDGVYLDILAPLESYSFEEVSNLNDTSIMIRLVYGETTLIFSGDAEKKAEQKIMLSATDIRAQILMGGHHGSRMSHSAELLQAISPDLVIMSNGKDNTYHHPHLDTVMRLDAAGIDWISTKDVGTIHIQSDGLEWEM